MDTIGGFLEVGTDGKGEIIVNHPDLKPDANGVGHIVFSPGQARALADLLRKKSYEAEEELETARIAALPPPPPVDRSKRVLASGAPVPDDDSHTELKPNGQQKDYVVLSAEERQRGFVRPLRMVYRHVGKRPKYPVRDLTEDEKVRFGSDWAKFEPYPESDKKGVGRFWTEAELKSGCNTTTVMSLAIAETYARDNTFYGGTFCCTCGKHFRLDEFVWEGTTETVGS